MSGASEIVCVVQCDHECREGSFCRTRIDFIEMAQTEWIQFEGHTYEFQIPMCRVPLMSGRVMSIMNVAAAYFHRRYVRGDADAVLYRFFRNYGPDWHDTLHLYLADVVPAYKSSYTCYYWLRDVARAMHLFQRGRWRCEQCRRISEWGEGQIWLGRVFCSEACRRRAARRVQAQERRAERERQCLRNGKKTLRAIRQLLRGKKNLEV